MKRFAVAAIAFFALTGAGFAQGVHVEGIIDCGLWVKARTVARANVFEGYLVGLLNGMSIGRGVEFWRAGGLPSLTQDQVFLWMDGFCRREPLSGVVRGAYVLMEERTAEEYTRALGMSK